MISFVITCKFTNTRNLPLSYSYCDKFKFTHTNNMKNSTKTKHHKQLTIYSKGKTINKLSLFSRSTFHDWLNHGKMLNKKLESVLTPILLEQK